MKNSENGPMNEDNDLSQDKSLQCIRIEINSHVTCFLYYKQYPKANSERFPQERTAIIFFFDDTHVNERFLWTYISLVGQIEDLELGSYINKRGNKKKRRVINFALVKFLEEEFLQSFLNRYETQVKINDYVELKRNRNVNLDYDPLKDEEVEEEELDEEGFVTVTKDKTKKRFSKKGLSFKVSKDQSDCKEEKTDKEKGDFYWNYQLLDKKRQSILLLTISV
jgi:hypothetical protein